MDFVTVRSSPGRRGGWVRRSRQGPPAIAEAYSRRKSIAGHRVVSYVDLGETGTEVRYLTFMRDPLKSAASRFKYKVQVSGKRDLIFEEWIQTKQIAVSMTSMRLFG